MVLTSTHNLSFEQKYEKYQKFLSEKKNQFLEVKFLIYLHRRVFVMETVNEWKMSVQKKNSLKENYKKSDRMEMVIAKMLLSMQIRNKI